MEHKKFISTIRKLRILDLFPDKMYLSIVYFIKNRKKINWNFPKTYDEKLQWLKVYDRKEIYTKMVDKYEVKKYIESIVGKEYVIPTIGTWKTFDEIKVEELPEKFVLKCTHDSGGLIVCKDKKEFNVDLARNIINQSLKQNYFWRGREWPYKKIKPRIIAEEYIDVKECEVKDRGDGSEDRISAFDLQKKWGLLDYKFMCFSGEVKALFLDIGVIGESINHAKEYYRNIYDKNGKLLPVRETRENYPQQIILPENLQEMVSIAERLSQGFPHLRVDLYNVNGKIKVGELTFFHGSGMSNKFIPEEWGEKFGSWIQLPSKKR